MHELRTSKITFPKPKIPKFTMMMMMMVLFCLSKRTPLLNGLGFSRYANSLRQNAAITPHHPNHSHPNLQSSSRVEDLGLLLRQAHPRGRCHHQLPHRRLHARPKLQLRPCRSSHQRPQCHHHLVFRHLPQVLRESAHAAWRGSSKHSSPSESSRSSCATSRTRARPRGPASRRTCGRCRRTRRWWHCGLWCELWQGRS